MEPVLSRELLPIKMIISGAIEDPHSVFSPFSHFNQKNLTLHPVIERIVSEKAMSPDYCIPDEGNPAVVIEAKINSDDGTARDKVARIKELENQHNQHVTEGRPYYEVVACIDGRGFKERREEF